MSEHFSAQQLENYRQRRMKPDEVLALDDHLAVCDECLQRLREMIPTHAAFLSLQASLQTADAMVESQSFSTRILSLIGWPTLRELMVTSLTFRVASAAAMVALFVLAAMFWRVRSDKPQIAGHQPTPAPPGLTPTAAIPIPSPSKTQPDSPILLALNDGGSQVKLDAQGNLSGLESLSPTDQQRVKTALTTQRVETPKMLRELKSTSGDVMGSPTDASFSLLSPIGKIVASNRPTLRWQPLRGAINYQVTITDPEANYTEVAVSPALSDAKWTVDHPLKRGRVYTWQVTARTESGEVRAPALNAPEAKFRVLERVNADELARAEKAYAGSPLTLGLLYAQAGLLDEAEREFQALVKANPESHVAKNLLRDVRAKRRPLVRYRER